MEGSDPFAAGVETGSDDPFAGTDFGDFEQVDPDAPPPEGARELKTVDKEGNELPPGQAAPAHAPSDGAQSGSDTGQAAQPSSEAPVEPQAAPAPAEVAQEAAPAADPTSPSTASSPEPTPDGSGQPGSPAASPTESAPAPVEASTPASSASTSGASPEQAGGDQGSPTPASPAPPSPAAASTSSSSEPEVEDAPPPEEPKDKRGRATARRYIILRVDGPGKFTQVHWYEDDKGKMLTKREPGSRRQTVALCKTAEEALKLGYAACGGPAEGVNLVATAALHFQPKVVKPMPPEPLKQRLSIG